MGQQEIIEVFLKEKNRPITIREIVERTGIDFSSVWTSLQSMLKYNEVIKKKRMIVKLFHDKNREYKRRTKVVTYQLNEKLLLERRF